MAKIETYFIPEIDYLKLLACEIKAIEYSPNKMPNIGHEIRLRPYNGSCDVDALSVMDARIVDIKEIPRKRGQIKRWSFTLNVQLIMF